MSHVYKNQKIKAFQGQCYICRKHTDSKNLELIAQQEKLYYVCRDCERDWNERKTGR
jgi:hypothetical protein